MRDEEWGQPSDDAHPDLLWLATHLNQWPEDGYEKVRIDTDGEVCFWPGIEHDFYSDRKGEGVDFTYEEWRDLREHLHIKEDETLKFGDMLHIDGEPVVYWGQDTSDKYHRVIKEGVSNPIVVEKESFDEFKPNPVDQRKEALLKLWRSQGIDFAHDTYNEAVDVKVDRLFMWMEENKDEICSILTS